MSESLGGTPMTIFHTLNDMCEGVGQNSGYVMGAGGGGGGGGGGGVGSHLMHDINYSMCEI